MTSNWKPWWQQVGELSTRAEQEEFIRGIGGAKKSGVSENILLTLLAGYVGGKIAQRTGRNK